jgi:hypothetical protein
MLHGVDDDPAFYFSAEVDRQGDTDATRKIDINDAKLSSQAIYLFYDHIYVQNFPASGFLGWIRIQPANATANLHAGEVALASTLSMSNASISVWDPASNSYVGVLTVNPTSIALPQTVTFPINYSLIDPLHPQITYDIAATLQINPAIGPDTTTYPSGAVASVNVQVPTISGTIAYRVYDDIWGVDLYDIDFSFESAGFDANVAYFVPDE